MKFKQFYNNFLNSPCVDEFIAEKQKQTKCPLKQLICAMYCHDFLRQGVYWKKIYDEIPEKYKFVFKEQYEIFLKPKMKVFWKPMMDELKSFKDNKTDDKFYELFPSAGRVK